jgi:hypothetical protein
VRILLVGPVEDFAVRDIEAISLGDLVEGDRDLAVLVMLKLDEIDRLEDLAIGTGVEHLFGLWVDALVQLLAQVAHSQFPPVLDMEAKYQDEGRKPRRSNDSRALQPSLLDWPSQQRFSSKPESPGLA